LPWLPTLTTSVYYCPVRRAALLVLPLVTLLAVSAELTAGPMVAGRGSAEELLAAARVALDGEQWQQAETLFGEVALAAPGLIDAYHGLAAALVGQKRRGEAALVLRALGNALLTSGRHADAAEALEKVVELAPDAADHAALGRALLHAQRFAAATEHLRAALELGAAAGPVEVYLGSALWESGRFEEAESVLRRAAERPEVRTLASHHLGSLLLWRGRFAEAVVELRRARADGISGVDLDLELARALEGAGELEEALEAYSRAVTAAPDRYPQRHGLARVLARVGRREEAEREMAVYHRLVREDQARVRRQGLEKAQLDAAWELLWAGQPEEAARRFAALVESAEALVGLAQSRLALGDPAAALAALEGAVALAPERQDLRLQLAEARQALSGEP
jgi:tetratricopeptide (TPR) repeat protein